MYGRYTFKLCEFLSFQKGYITNVKVKNNLVMRCLSIRMYSSGNSQHKFSEYNKRKKENRHGRNLKSVAEIKYGVSRDSYTARQLRMMWSKDEVEAL